MILAASVSHCDLIRHPIKSHCGFAAPLLLKSPCGRGPVVAVSFGGFGRVALSNVGNISH